jgi:hypothetical protein
MINDERISEYMLLVASNLVVAVAAKNPEKIHAVLIDVKETIDSYVEAAEKNLELDGE